MSKNLSQNNKESKEVWDASKKYQIDFEPDVEQGLVRLHQRIAADKKQGAKVVPMRRRFLTRAAAVVLLLTVAAFGFNQFWGNAEGKWVTIASNDSIQKVSLPDGSSAWLKENTQLSYVRGFKGNERQLKLEGEAFFNVAKNPEKPFIIQAGKGNVTVLGTSFSVDTKGTKTEVLVKTGKVAFTPNAETAAVYLTKNMKATFEKGNKKATIEKAVSLNKLAWQTGKLSYRGAKISEILKDIETFYSVSIDLKNKDLANCSWTNIINVKNVDIKTSLSTFLSYFELDLVQNGKEVELIGGKKTCK